MVSTRLDGPRIDWAGKCDDGIYKFTDARCDDTRAFEVDCARLQPPQSCPEFNAHAACEYAARYLNRTAAAMYIEQRLKCAKGDVCAINKGKTPPLQQALAKCHPDEDAKTCARLAKACGKPDEAENLATHCPTFVHQLSPEGVDLVERCLRAHCGDYAEACFYGIFDGLYDPTTL